MISGFSRPQEMRDENIKVLENYLCFLSRPLGKGNFSEVFYGTDKNTNKEVAIKIIKKSSLNSKVAEQLFRNEVTILQELDHESVLKCNDVLSSKNNCYIITEFYEGGDLEKELQRKKRFSEREVSKYIYYIFQGLLYLQNKFIIHRDLKIANIFLSKNGNPKIADFGFATKSNESFKDIKIGSPIYMSPEGLLLNEYSPKTDVWSFGVLIYEMIHGDTPLSGCRS